MPIQCVSAAASATVVTTVVAAAAEAAAAAANEYENEDKDPSTAVTAKAIIVTHYKRPPFLSSSHTMWIRRVVLPSHFQKKHLTFPDYGV